MNHRYSFCGFALTSDVSIPELSENRGGVTDTDRVITVQFGEVSRDVPNPSEWFMRQDLPNGAPWTERARTSDGYLLRFVGMADFWVDRAGEHITCVARHSSTSDLTIRAILLDHVIPR